MIFFENQWTTQVHMTLFVLSSLSACANVFDADTIEFRGEDEVTRACTDARDPQLNVSCAVTADCAAPLKCTEIDDISGSICLRPCVDDQQCEDIPGACVTKEQIADIFVSNACTDSQELQINQACNFEVACELPLVCLIDNGVGQCIKSCVDDRQCNGVGDCVPADEVISAQDRVQGFCEEPFFNDDDQIPCDDDAGCAPFAPSDLRLICGREDRLCHRTCTEDAECLEDNCIRIPNASP